MEATVGLAEGVSYSLAGDPLVLFRERLLVSNDTWILVVSYK